MIAATTNPALGGICCGAGHKDEFPGFSASSDRPSRPSVLSFPKGTQDGYKMQSLS